MKRKKTTQDYLKELGNILKPMNNQTKTNPKAKRVPETRTKSPERELREEQWRMYPNTAPDNWKAQQPQHSPDETWNNYIAMEKEAVLYRNHADRISAVADKLAEACKAALQCQLDGLDENTVDTLEQALAEYQNARHGGQAAGGES